MVEKEKKEKKKEPVLIARARLKLNKVQVGLDKSSKECLKEVSFDIIEPGGANQILSPRIVLDGNSFPAWLQSGKDEIYDVRLSIHAERTEFEHKGIPADVIEEEDQSGPVPAKDK